MTTRSRVICSLAIMMSVLAATVTAQDGRLMAAQQPMLAGNAWGHNIRWSETSIYPWLNGQVAQNGGVAYLDVESGQQHSMYITNIFANLALSGIDFGYASYKICGNAITLIGERPFLNASYYVVVPAASTTLPDKSFLFRKGVTIVPQLSGTGVLEKRGGGKIYLSVPLNGFSAVDVKGGVLSTTTATGDAICTCPVTLDGALSYNAAEVPAAGVGAVSVAAGGITVMPNAHLIVNKMDGASATMTVGALTRGEKGFLIVRGSAGTLGADEKVLSTGTVPQYASGLVEPWIATRIVSGNADYPVNLLKYDATDGFKAFDAYKTSFAAAGASDAVRISSATTLSVDAQAAALVVDGADNLKIDSGVTLRLGDGTLTGALVLNFTGGTGSANEAFTFSGTIDFGDKPGIIWLGGPGPNDTQVKGGIVFQGRVTGSAGVTFVSGGGADIGHYVGSGSPDYTPPRPVVMMKTAPGWTGGTKFVGCEVRLYENVFAAGQTVDFDGGDIYQGTQTYTFDYKNLAADFKMRGHTVYNVPNYKAGDGMSFKGHGELTGDTWIELGNIVPFVTFDGAISGAGRLVLAGQKNNLFTFKNANTYQGETVIGDGTWTGKVLLTGAGTFGNGPVRVLHPDSVVEFDRVTDSVISNSFINPGTTKISYSKVAFTGETELADVTVLGSSEIGIGSRTRVDRLAATLADVVKSAAEGAVLELGGKDGSSLVPGSMQGTFDIVKSGTGTLTLHAETEGWNGNVFVKDGRIDLCGRMDPLTDTNSISFWVDGAVAGSIMKDGNGLVTNWSPRVARGFSRASETRCPNATTTVNGHEVLSFSDNYAQATMRSLYAGECTMRTVFLVAVPNACGDMAGLFGSSSSDLGFRVISDANFYGYRTKNTGATYNTTGGVRLNGVQCTALDVERVEAARIEDGRTDVITLVHENNDLNTDTFAPAIGAYGNRGFDGAICEVIGFNRVLSEGEIKMVENYLMEKWKNVPEQHAAPDALPAFATTGRFDLAEQATLALNGRSLEVGSFIGRGRIVNDSDMAVTITVNGESSFAGEISGNVKIVQRADAVYSIADGLPSTEGMAYWLDASADASVVKDGDVITAWNSRAGTATSFAPNKSGAATYNTANATVGNLPTVDIPSGDNKLTANAATTTRTLFFVHVDNAHTGGGNPFMWSISARPRNRDVGLYYSGANFSGADNKYPSIHYSASAFLAFDSYTTFGDIWRLNGVMPDFKIIDEDCRESCPMPANGVPYMISFSIASENPHYNLSTANVIGGNSTRAQSVCEVIAYERSLDVDEMRQIETYLRRKWITRDLPAARTSVFPSPVALDLSGTNGVPVAATVEGAVDLTKIALSVKGIDKTHPSYDVFNAPSGTGSFGSVDIERLLQNPLITGVARASCPCFMAGRPCHEGFCKSFIDGGWSLNESGGKWKLSRTGMVIIFR